MDISADTYVSVDLSVIFCVFYLFDWASGEGAYTLSFSCHIL